MAPFTSHDLLLCVISSADCLQLFPCLNQLLLLTVLMLYITSVAREHRQNPYKLVQCSLSMDTKFQSIYFFLFHFPVK